MRTSPPDPLGRWPWEVCSGLGLGLAVLVTSWSWGGAVIAGAAVAAGLAGLIVLRHPVSRGLAYGAVGGGALFFVSLLLSPRGG